MAVDWKSLLEVARELVKQAPHSVNPEAWYRSALSRVYFGAYGHARAYAISFLQYTSRAAPEDHGSLKAHLRRRRRDGDADRLDQLRVWRNQADYDEELPSSFNLIPKCAEALALAERIFLSLTPPKKV